MRYRELLRFEGTCSVVLGLALAALAFPGLLVSYPAAWTGLLFVPAVLLVLGAWAVLRRGSSPWRPGEWLTARPLATATGERRALPSGPLRRRLIVETTIWILAAGAWILLARSSGLVFFGTGLASAAYGLLQAVPSARRVAAVEARSGETFVIARRPGFGTPELGTLPAREPASELDAAQGASSDEGVPAAGAPVATTHP
ncbi:MAG: hypothetical protein AVDCRST_MAG45-2222 [uncultured Solirubrobacterales bacterium]|uniref:Uncharacterized protein n=1 Tax=uncultured Solirubrobacterales bacterium TaxID=768556 RepID=A0A6J4T904_9ACTN|nr:MAG: hypothetical protein AVDCRST_MAG45-2222 [uncultured Solirubrobacterales bacterium]